MSVAVAIGLGAALGAAAPGSLLGQEGPGSGSEEHRHRGFWLSGGLGPGVDDEGEAGAAIYFRLGGTPGSRILLGGEFLGMAREEDDVTLGRGNASFVALFYPGRSGGFFLKAGVGFATVEASTEVGDGATLSVSEEGVGGVLGVGGDVRLGSNLYLTPNADLALQSFDGEVEPLFLFTVGLTMH
jgi:hypothetical protein